VPSLAGDPEEESLLRKAGAAVEDGMYKGADRTLEKFLKKSPSEAAAAQGKILLAQSYVAQGRFMDVLELLKNGAGKTGDPALNVGLLYWKARAFYELDRLGETAAVLKELPSQSESAWQVPAHFLNVRVARAEGRREAAVQDMVKFDQLYAEHPEAAVNLFELGLLYLESDQHEKALETLRSLLTRFPATSSALEGTLWLARELYRAGPPEEAVALLQALGSNEDAASPLRLEALRSLAQFYEESKQLEEGLNVLNQALGLLPPPEEKAILTSMQSLILLSLGREQEAVTMMHEAVQGMTNQVAASRLQLRIADQLLKRGSHALALEEYQRFLEVFTDGAGRGLAALGKAWSLFGLERYTEAAEYFEQAATMVKDENVLQEAFIKLGDSWFSSKQYEKAAAAYRDFLLRFPSSSYSVNARFQLSESLARLGRVEEAVQELRIIEQGTEKESQARLAALRVAELRQRDGQFKQAVEAYNWILEKYKDPETQAQAILGRASVRYSLGQFYEALDDLDRIGGEFAETVYAERALAMSVWCQYLSGRDEMALQLASEFIENYTDSALAPQIQFWKAEYRYNRDEFKDAEALFVLLARTYKDHELADDALFWAGRSAFEQKEYQKAVSIYKELIESFPESGKRAEARFAQGDALSKLGEFAGAILAFEEIIRQFPDHYLVDEARGRIGDCHFTLGGQDPARYRDSLDAYAMILSRGRASSEMAQQSQYKIGRCYEKLEDAEQALSYYLQAVYGYMDSSHTGKVVSSVWFSRAAFAAADLLESTGRLKEAAKLYKRVVTAQVPAAEDAQNRLQKLRLENWWIL
jgi:TolA-binding protein